MKFDVYQRRIRSLKPNPLSILLRATRFCFYYSDAHHAYLRMQWVDEENGGIFIEACPPESIRYITDKENINKKRGGIEYIAWRENQDHGEKVLSLLHLPQKKFTHYEIFFVNISKEPLEENAA